MDPAPAVLVILKHVQGEEFSSWSLLDKTIDLNLRIS
jgi:hypothetical protein